MLDFKGKVIKVFLNATSGYVVQTGPFLGMEDDFIMLRNPITKEINYISKYYVKYIEIVRDIDPTKDLACSN